MVLPSWFNKRTHRMNLYIKLSVIFSIFLLDLCANPRIGIISDAAYIGEREVGWRIKRAAEILGWEAFLDEKAGMEIKDMKGLDWVICILPFNRNLNASCPNYLAVFHPLNFLDEECRLNSLYEDYDGYLLSIKPTESFDSRFKSKNKMFFSTIFYPTVPPFPYMRVPLNNLVTTMPKWGNRINSAKFRALYKILNKSGFTKFYGSEPCFKFIEEGYLGCIPFDGVSMIRALQQHGIVLIIHSDMHNKNGIPSSRIFEAAAASTVIISDENPFVKKHFGDAVFYIDTSLPPKEIFMQIENHMDFIHSNPRIALDMAKRSYQIFLENFTMTDQLIKVNNMDQKFKHYQTLQKLGYMQP